MSQKWMKKHPGLAELLGVVPDAELGRQFGLTRSRVHQLRKQMGLTKVLRANDPEIEVKLLAVEDKIGKVSDSSIARELGIGFDQVRARRKVLNRPVFIDTIREEKWNQIKDRAGKVTDGVLAKEIGVSINTVLLWRKRYGIESAHVSPRSKRFQPVDRNKLIELFNQGLSDEEIAATLNAKLSYLPMIRRKLGLLRAAGRGSNKGMNTKYPWDTWADGDEHTIVHGVDFHCGHWSLANLIRREAKNRGLKAWVSVKVGDPGTIRFRLTKVLGHQDSNLD